MERASDAEPWVDVEFVTHASRRRQCREPGTEALDAPALLVDGRRSSAGERTAWMSATRARELRGVGVVAGEQIDAAYERMAQDFAVLGRAARDRPHRPSVGPSGHNLLLCLGALTVPYRAPPWTPHVWCAETYQVHRRRVGGKPRFVGQDTQIARPGNRVTRDIHHPARGKMCHGAQNLAGTDARRV